MIRKGEEFTLVFREVRREREKIRRRINLLDLPQLFCFHGVDLVEKDVKLREFPTLKIIKLGLCGGFGLKFYRLEVYKG